MLRLKLLFAKLITCFFVALLCMSSCYAASGGPGPLATNIVINSSTTISGPGTYGVATPNITITLPNWTLWTFLGDVRIKDLTGQSNPNITIQPFPGDGGTIDNLSSVSITTPLGALILAPFMGGNQWLSVSSAAGTSTPTAPVNVVLPVISGSPVVGNTLTATQGTWTESPTSFAFQWLANGSAISGATSSTFVATSGQVGDNLTVRVTATNSIGSAAATSTAVGPVTATVIAPTNSVLPVISGSPIVGSTLTTTTGTWTGSPTGFTEQWLANGSAISGATATTFVPTSAQLTDNITVTVTATNSAGSTAATSTAVGPVTAPTSPPVNSVAPVISGTPQVGNTLTASDGTWSGSPTFTFSWNGVGSPTNAATYTPVSGDVGNNLTVTVTATNSAGSASQPSAAVGPVTASGGLVACTGGTQTTVGGNIIATFATIGTTSLSGCTGSFSAQILVVGGGGGASAAGGGAGGYCTTEGTPTCGLGSSVTIPSGSTTVTVGGSGTAVSGASTPPAGNGGNSVLGSLVTALGGGGGGGINSNNTGGGGSGGGAGPTSGGPFTGGVGTQGSNGGASFASTTGIGPGAGGGGAGGVGVTPTSDTVAGNGGAGLSNSINGTATFYSGGGGGGFITTGGVTPGTGGVGGGGNGVTGGGGHAGTGFGSGGGGGEGASSGGIGGQGIVIISCPTSVCSAL
jgi:hypothetical protein